MQDRKFGSCAKFQRTQIRVERGKKLQVGDIAISERPGAEFGEAAIFQSLPAVGDFHFPVDQSLEGLPGIAHHRAGRGKAHSGFLGGADPVFEVFKFFEARFVFLYHRRGEGRDGARAAADQYVGSLCLFIQNCDPRNEIAAVRQVDVMTFMFYRGFGHAVILILKGACRVNNDVRFCCFEHRLQIFMDIGGKDLNGVGGLQVFCRCFGFSFERPARMRVMFLSGASFCAISVPNCP